MSATDILPPKAFSTVGTSVNKTTNWNITRKTWDAPTTSTTTQTSSTGSETRSGEVTPGYMQKAQMGQLPEHTFGYARVTYRYFYGSLLWMKSANQIKESTGVFGQAFMINPSVKSISSIRKSNLENEVKQKVLIKIRDQEVNLAVAAAESEKTWKTIATAAKRFHKAYNCAKRGDLSGAAAALGVKFPNGGPGPSGLILDPKRQMEAISSGWLELQYGWLPLLSDIFGAAQYIEKNLLPARQYRTVKLSKKIQEDSQSIVVSNDYRDNTTYSSTYTIIVVVKMKASSTILKTLGELGFTNPLLVAWELVPLSFVADWILPVSSFLSQFDATLGWTFDTGSVTRVRRDYAITYRVSNNPAGYVYHYCSGFADTEDFSLNRVGLTGFSNLLSIPYVKDPASVLHTLNALALLTSKR